MHHRLHWLLAWWPVEKAVTVACVLGLIALTWMALGVVLGTPLWVVGSMSVAQGLGLTAGALFALSVGADAGVKRAKRS
ncbi:MAG: hypothetical protein K1X89_21035 [Myxococcaceae bacterium]|nr:hypothetical protein [Myxococcaceae bacterium]